MFAMKFRGKRVELTKSEDAIITKPVHSYVASARGMLKGGNFGTHTLLSQKKIDKELECGN